MGDINGGDIIQLSVSLSTVDTHSHHYQLFSYLSTRNNVEKVLKKKWAFQLRYHIWNLELLHCLFVCFLGVLPEFS